MPAKRIPGEIFPAHRIDKIKADHEQTGDKIRDKQGADFAAGKLTPASVQAEDVAGQKEKKREMEGVKIRINRWKI